MAACDLRSRRLTSLLSLLSITIVVLLLSMNAAAQSVDDESRPASLVGVEPQSSLLSNIRDSAPTLDLAHGPSVRQDRTFNIVLGGFLTAASTDLAVSMYQINQGVARERGFGAAWQDSPVLFAASKTAMSAAFAYGLQRVHKTRPKTALIMGLAATSFESWLVVRSARLSSPPTIW